MYFVDSWIHINTFVHNIEDHGQFLNRQSCYFLQYVPGYKLVLWFSLVSGYYPFPTGCDMVLIRDGTSASANGLKILHKVNEAGRFHLLFGLIKTNSSYHSVGQMAVCNDHCVTISNLVKTTSILKTGAD